MHTFSELELYKMAHLLVFSQGKLQEPHRQHVFPRDELQGATRPAHVFPGFELKEVHSSFSHSLKA